MRYSYPLIKWWRRKGFKSGPCLLPAGVIDRGAGEKDNLSVLDASIEYQASRIEYRVSSLFFLPVLHYELSPDLINAGL